MTAVMQQRDLFPGHGAWDAVQTWEKQYIDRLRELQQPVTVESHFKPVRVMMPGSVDAYKSVVLWGGVGWSAAWFDRADRNIRWLPIEKRFTIGDRLIIAARTAGQRQRFYFITVCEVCSLAFLTSRDDSITCGPTCRKRRSRLS